MNNKNCQICNAPSGFYPLCRLHNSLRSRGFVYKDIELNRWVLKEGVGMSFDKCVLCEAKTENGYALCNSCKDSCDVLKTEIDRNRVPLMLKDSYYTLKALAYRIVDSRNLLVLTKYMIAIANVCFDSHEDLSLASRVFPDVYDIITKHKEKKYTITPSPLTNVNDQMKLCVLRCNDGHVVRSSGEVIIDDILYSLRLIHSYYSDIVLLSSKDNIQKAGWYLPIVNNIGVYIEYLSPFCNEDFDEKRELYRKEGLYLIEIKPDEVKDRALLSVRIKSEYQKYKDEILKNL